MWLTPMYDTTKLTLELRELVDNVENPVDIWDFEYDSFYQGEEKKAFERKVIDHFYFRQIGQETVGRFKHMFRTRVQEIAPYYRRMYESVKIMDEVEDPFGNVDITETFEELKTGESSGQSSGTNEFSNSEQGSERLETNDQISNMNEKSSSEDKVRKFSNTPQGSISNLENYLTEGTIEDNGTTENEEGSSSETRNHETTSSGSGSGNSTSQASSSETNNETVKHTLTRKGNQGVNTYAHDMMEYRQAIINVDMMFINNLQDLFLGVY